MKNVDYDSLKLSEFYNFHQQFGAVFDDLLASQYGFKNGKVNDPTRYYFFHFVFLRLLHSLIKEGAFLLDIGCGAGIVAEAVLPKTARYIGLDISLERIKQAHNRIKDNRCFFIVGDAQELPFEDAFFDTVIATEIIEHLPDTLSCIREVNRVLKKNGFFIISTPTGLFFEDNTAQLYKDQHVYIFSPSKLKFLLEKGGFSVEKITGIGFKLPKLQIPLWLGSDAIKWLYHKIKNTPLKSGYGHPISLQFDVISNPLLNKLYFCSEKIWLILMKIFDFIGRHQPIFSSNLIIICKKK